MRKYNLFKITAMNIVWLWLLLFACLPFLLTIAVSLLNYDDNHLLHFTLTIDHYLGLIKITYAHILLRSLLLAAITTWLCLVLAYPCAYYLAQLPAALKNYGVLLVVIPFWTSSLVRTYALIAILKSKGVLNTILMSLGIIKHPLQIMYSNSAVIIGLVYNLLPFMILPILTNIDKLDRRLIDAARDLGAKPTTIFLRIVLPLTKSGIISGCVLVFLPAMTMFYIPDILGGAKSVLMGNLIQRQFLVLHDWHAGSATSVVMTAGIMLLIAIYLRTTSFKG